MATAREVITLAYREANFNAVSKTPTDTELTEGLTLLQALVDSAIGMVIGIRARPWYIPQPQRTAAVAANFPAEPGDQSRTENPNYPPANSRIFMRNDNDATVYLQYQPEDGAFIEYVDVGHTGTVTLDANGALFGLAGSNETVIIEALFPAGRNTPRRWMFRGDYGSWLEVVTLTLDVDIPFPTRFDDYFIAALAMRLSPRFGQEPRQVTVLRYQQMEQFIRGQYQQTAPAIGGDLGVPTYQNWDTGYGPDNFGRGIP